MFLSIVILIIGFILLIKGADIFVDGSSNIAKKFGVPTILIALTIVSFGTSAPELSVSLAAAFKNNADITLGNILGSNILNILFILGITALIKPIKVPNTSVKFDLPFLSFISVLLLLLTLDNKVTLTDGLIFMVLLVVFIIYLFKLSKNSGEEKKTYKINLVRSIAFIVLGLASVIFGSELVVSESVKIAKSFNVSERIIGLTIIAFGTSLPEIVTSITAALKNQSDIAVGNIVGSNILNVILILGITSLIITVPSNSSFTMDFYLNIIASVLLFVFAFTRKELGRLEGLVFLVIYFSYLIYTII